MKPLPRATSGSIVTLDGDLYNSIAENIERMDKWVVQPPLNLQQTPSGNLLSMSGGLDNLVGVIVLGPDAGGGGGGYYRGSIIQGKSNGGTGGTNTFSPAHFNYQFFSSTNQTAIDGPTWTQDVHGSPVNNALVVNLPEQYVPSSHKLTGTSSYTVALGRVMGQTNESPSRTIVYVDAWPIKPVIAKITAQNPVACGGLYYGEICSGLFASFGNFYNDLISSVAALGISGNNDCWICNGWEHQYRPGSGTSQLPVGTFVPGWLVGWPVGIPGNGSGIWYQVYTWFAPQSAAPSTIIGAASTSAGHGAGTSYTTNEQGIINDLVADMTNLWAMMHSMYTNMKTAGYTG